MEHQLSKREKKIARDCISKALEAEFREAMTRFEAIIDEWKQGKITDTGEAYRTLHRAIREKDKEIARRYDHQSGSTYLDTVIDIFIDGYISEADIKDFSEETKAIINRGVQFAKSMRVTIPNGRD